MLGRRSAARQLLGSQGSLFGESTYASSTKTRLATVETTTTKIRSAATTAKEQDGEAVVFYDLCGAGDLRFSPFCWRTRACLLYKGIKFRAEPTTFFTIPAKFKEFSLEVPAKNPYPTVPFLFHGNQKIVDSWDIALYLDKQFPERKVFPSEGMIEACRFFSDQVNKLHLPILKSEAGSINKRLLPEDKEIFRQKIKKRTSKEIEEVHANAAEFEAALKENMKIFTSFMSSGNKDFAFGSMFTFADIALFGTLKWLVLVSDKGTQWLEIDQGLLAWWKRVHATLHLDE